MARNTLLTVVVPCYNEEKTLALSVGRVLGLKSADLDLEVIIVDDRSKDKSLEIAGKLGEEHPEIRVLRHEVNMGKGAALRTGFAAATGDIVTIQDADLEYDPLEIRKLVAPILEGRADVVYGSRFLGGKPSEPGYLANYLANMFLTKLSNFFTGLKLTDMETCYKVFKREVIKSVKIVENRFGFEPEITAKIAGSGWRVAEAAVTYSPRKHEEGKKIGWKDGLRAIYCIIRYNADQIRTGKQFLVYTFIGGIAAIVNLAAFLALYEMKTQVSIAAPVAYIIGALANYFLCITLLFRHNSRWSTPLEVLAYIVIIASTGAVDLWITAWTMGMGMAPWLAKSVATVIGLGLNFFGRKLLVFGKRA